MTNNIDELSRTLGQIQADVSYTRKNTEAIDNKVDRLSKSVVQQEMTIKSAHERLDNIIPHIDDYRAFKQKGIGFIGAISLFFGFIGSLVIKLISSVF